MEFLSQDGRRLVELPLAVRSDAAALSVGSPKETGGVLVGRNDKDGRFVITRALPPPPDSRSTATSFRRGKQGMDGVLAKLWKGGERYIGEWHFHPGAAPIPSPTDRKSLASIARDKGYDCPAPLLLILGGDDAAEISLHEFIEGQFAGMVRNPPEAWE